MYSAIMAIPSSLWLQQAVIDARGQHAQMNVLFEPLNLPTYSPTRVSLSGDQNAHNKGPQKNGTDK
jgi:hypothetical protein